MPEINEPTRQERLALPDENTLEPLDFELLARPFIQAVAFLFPEAFELSFLAGEAAPALQQICPEGKAAGEEGSSSESYGFSVPLMPGVALRLKTSDKELAGRVAETWLQEQAEASLHILSLIRPAFIERLTGCYNGRALAEALTSVPENALFFLLCAGTDKKGLAEKANERLEQAAFLRQHVRGALFSCGFGLFAIIFDKTDHGGQDAARKKACLLQRRLKQEGLSRAQIVYAEAGRARHIFAEKGLAGFASALENAGRQGPFGLFCAADEIERRTERFRLRENACFLQLQKKWRSESRFSLALFRLETTGETSGETPGFSPDLLEQAGLAGKNLIRDGAHCLAGFFAKASPEEARVQASAMQKALTEALPGASIAVGLAGYPCLDYAKKQTPSNCLKALLHASLLGPGQAVVFDHLSLNVSGDTFYAEGDYRSAVHEYQRGLRLRPDDVNLLNSLGVAFAASGRERGAVDCFHRVLEFEADNHMALANLGLILARHGKKDEALSCLHKAWAACSQTEEKLPADLLRTLAGLQLEKERYQEVLMTLESWAKAGDIQNEPFYFRAQGLALEATASLDKAMRAFERALQLAPQDAVSLAHMGALYQTRGEGEALALHFCQEAVRLKPDEASLWRILGEILLDSGKADEALAAADKCLGLNKADIRGLWLAARAYLQKKNERNALSLLNKAIKLHTIDASLQDKMLKAKKEVEKNFHPRKAGAAC